MRADLEQVVRGIDDRVLDERCFRRVFGGHDEGAA
jgi:hypothetical protein